MLETTPVAVGAATILGVTVFAGAMYGLWIKPHIDRTTAQNSRTE